MPRRFDRLDLAFSGGFGKREELDDTHEDCFRHELEFGNGWTLREDCRPLEPGIDILTTEAKVTLGNQTSFN